MAYSKQTWIGEPNQTTPLSAARLNHMEAGIESVDKKVLVLNVGDPVPGGTPAGTVIVRK